MVFDHIMFISSIDGLVVYVVDWYYGDIYYC